MVARLPFDDACPLCSRVLVACVKRVVVEQKQQYLSKVDCATSMMSNRFVVNMFHDDFDGEQLDGSEINVIKVC